MIISSIFGGLGNQLYQYCCGRALSYKLKTNLGYETSFFNGNVSKHAVFQLDLFKTNGEVLKNTPKLITYEEKTNNCKPNAFDKNILDIKDNTHIVGYWKSYKYFIDVWPMLKEELIIKQTTNVNLNNAIMQEENPVSLHIRLNDYQKLSGYFVQLGRTDYYAKAIDIINEKVTNPKFFVFSDDIPQAKKILGDRVKDAHFVNEPNAINALQAMSLCGHNINANSSFSWWGAFLNDNSNKIVIAPQRYCVSVQTKTSDLYPKEWTLI